jgi:hypothetical protein
MRMPKRTSISKKYDNSLGISISLMFLQAYALAKGLHASWEQLGDLSPTIPILCPLKTQFSRILSAPWQGTTHTDPDIASLINRVASKARSVDLHLRKPNRETKKRTVDILAKGHDMLQSKVMKAFTKRWEVWIAGTGVFEEEEDDIPVITSDTLIDL